MCRDNGIWRQCPSLIWPSTCPRPQSWSQAQRWVGGVCAGGTLPQGQAPITQDLFFFFFCLASISRLKTRAPRREWKSRGRGEGGEKGEEEGSLEGEGRKEGAESQLASATRFPAPWTGPHSHGTWALSWEWERSSGDLTLGGQWAL